MLTVRRMDPIIALDLAMDLAMDKVRKGGNSGCTYDLGEIPSKTLRIIEICDVKVRDNILHQSVSIPVLPVMSWLKHCFRCVPFYPVS